MDDGVGAGGSGPESEDGEGEDNESEGREEEEGDERLSMGEPSLVWSAGNGWAERRRTAWFMVGWKRPPHGEWRRRWVGRVWPEQKKCPAKLWLLAGGHGEKEKMTR